MESSATSPRALLRDAYTVSDEIAAALVFDRQRASRRRNLLLGGEAGATQEQVVSCFRACAPFRRLTAPSVESSRSAVRMARAHHESHRTPRLRRWLNRRQTPAGRRRSVGDPPSVRLFATFGFANQVRNPVALRSDQLVEDVQRATTALTVTFAPAIPPDHQLREVTSI